MKYLIAILITLSATAVFATEYTFRGYEYNQMVDEYTPPPPPPPPQTRLVVSTSSYVLDVVTGKDEVAQHRVIVGRSGHSTPTVETEFTDIIINPQWTVPDSLLHKLIGIIKNHRDPIAYMKKMTFRAYRDDKEIPIEEIDWAALPKTGPYDFSIRQDPGPDNFIGRVLFVLKDTGQIQLHDTPDKELFNSTKREFSAGCIRVENPIDLVATVTKKSRDEIAALVSTGETVTLILPKPIEVSVVD